ncbi:ABC transporter permease family protein [Nonomuraea turcica]|uniref:hypothetical protein n=1 Tax=Nonomuraea sp. G32 TaxID=3067274 RepID=UPI00273B7BE2|nr:hypothetical protein [Nonomuraea sp. G32]MDP4512180.1 hypothetical protein [Nonomuraea sp. G32]
MTMVTERPSVTRSRQAAPAPSANRVSRWQIYVPLALYLLFTLVPFYWMLVFAFRPRGSTSILPWPITFEHFDTVWNGILAFSRANAVH